MHKVWTIKIEFLDGTSKVFGYEHLKEVLDTPKRASENSVFFEVRKDGNIHLFPLVSIREITLE
jgi:hypothetical protein